MNESQKRIKFCPKCGSSNMNFVIFFQPSIWRCLACGYEGAFVVEDGRLAERIRGEFSKTAKEKQNPYT